jgi:hypothetical protein
MPETHSEIIQRTQRTLRLSQLALERFQARRAAIERGATSANDSLEE